MSAFFVFLIAAVISIILDPKELESFFNEQINDEFRKEYELSAVAISITQGEETIFFKGYGYQNYERKEKVTNQTVFCLASISKTFIAINSLKIGFGDRYDENVNDFLSDFKVPDTIHGNYYSHFGGYPHSKAEREIKIWNLLTHTEGLDVEVSYSYRHQTTMLSDIQDHFPPRIRQTNLVSTYSNYGATLLALIVQQNNPKKMEYGEFTKSAIFDPLKLKKSYYGYSNAKLDGDICDQTFYSKSGKYERFKAFTGEEREAVASGAIYSSSEDIQIYTKTLLRQINLDYLSDEDHKSLFNPLFLPNQHYPEPVINTKEEKGNKFPFQNSISSFFYNRNIGPITWIGHNGDVNPYHSQIMLNFQHNISIIIFGVGKGFGFRDVLRKRFSHRFLIVNETREKWCSSKNGDVYDSLTGFCKKTFSLSKDFPRSVSQVKARYKDDYVGCYLPFRFIHTSFFTTISILSLFWKHEVICLEIIDDKYLGIKGKKNQEPISTYTHDDDHDILFLESGNDLEGVEFVVGQRHDDFVEILIGDFIPPVASFVFEEKDGKILHRHFALSDIYNTYEFYGSKNKMFWEFFLFSFYTALTPIFGCLVIIFCCCFIIFGYNCCCIGKSASVLYKSIRILKKEKEPLIGSKNSINKDSHDLYFWKRNVAREYSLIDDDDDTNGKGSHGERGSSGIFSSKPKKNKLSKRIVNSIWLWGKDLCFEINHCCLVQYCILFLIVLVLGFNILHYLFMYLLGGLWLEAKDEYVPVIVIVGSYMPIFSVVFLGLLCICCCCCCSWNVVLETIFRCNFVPCHRYCHLCCLCCCVFLIFLVAVLYYVLAGFYSSFAFVSLVKSN